MVREAKKWTGGRSQSGTSVPRVPHLRRVAGPSVPVATARVCMQARGDGRTPCGARPTAVGQTLEVHKAGDRQSLVSLQCGSWGRSLSPRAHARRGGSPSGAQAGSPEPRAPEPAGARETGRGRRVRAGALRGDLGCWPAGLSGSTDARGTGRHPGKLCRLGVASWKP